MAYFITGGFINFSRELAYFIVGGFINAMWTLYPKNLKSKSLRIASVFIHPMVTSIWYCLGVLFGCGRTWGLEGTCYIYTHTSAVVRWENHRTKWDNCPAGHIWFPEGRYEWYEHETCLAFRVLKLLDWSTWSPCNGNCSEHILESPKKGMAPAQQVH